jgi:ATP-dependent DNA ligase
MSSFPILYGESSHGKRKVWKISVESRGSAAAILTEHGYENGKMVANERLVETGKNVGRSNETTPLQQAISEAQSAWNKKKDAGYAPDATGGSVPSGGSSDDKPVSPMLAHDYNKRGKSIIFPCFVQHKLDGVRCVVGKNGMFSRNGKKFPHLTHIQTAFQALESPDQSCEHNSQDRQRCQTLSGTDLILDGELYSDTLTFQEVVGLVKKEKITQEDRTKLLQIHLFVYDIVVDGTPYADRKARLESLIPIEGLYIRRVDTWVCNSADEVKGFHARSVESGYEGLMLRNAAAPYRRGVRSPDLQKYKEFEDAEYPVVGFKEGDGLEKGCVIWICKTSKGQEFAVRPRGTHDERTVLLAAAATYVGKELTVRFQELTTDGIPRFPVGIAFREYE